jgi:glycosyltransferase involved in cell wall biosynthesis
VKVAIVHDYLSQMGGAERVVVALHGLFPTAPIYTSIFDPASTWPELRTADIRPTWMQRLPGMPTHFKKYLLVYPSAIEGLPLDGYDLVLSSSSAYAKAARSRAGALHVCYCHNPMRFIWDYDRYVYGERVGAAARALLPLARSYLRRWDLRTAGRPHAYIANSSAVAERIRRYYGRSSEVIPPPVRLGPEPAGDQPGDYYLVVSRLSGYKRLDLAIEAFNRLGLPLIVVGDGPVRAELERQASPHIRFLGRRPDHEVAALYAGCRGLVVPGEEDFGITQVEANAAGRPVIAYAGGGALDIVVEGTTGVLVPAQTVDAIADGVRRAEATRWDARVIRRHAERFGEESFRDRLVAFLEGLLGRSLPPAGP